MSKYKLIYFNVRGLGEPIRLLLKHAQVPFEEFRYTSIEQWLKDREKYQFRKVPVLEVDGKPLGQSFAIIRYLAKKYGLAGHDDFEEAKVDAIADFFKDLRTEQEPYVFARMGWAVDGVGDWKGTKEDMEDLRKTCFLQAVEKHFPVFIEILKESKSGYLVNSGLTWVDFFVAEYLFTIQCLEPEIAKQHPQLFEYMKKVYSLPTITDYVATREHENW